MSTNQSQVLPGGILIRPIPFGAPGRLSAGWTRPAGVESLLPCLCCPIEFMVTSSGVPWLQEVVRLIGHEPVGTPGPRPQLVEVGEESGKETRPVLQR